MEIAYETYLIRQTEEVDADSYHKYISMLCGAIGTVNYMELRGAKQMKFKDLTFKSTAMPKGIQALLGFGDYELSIVKSDFSYGGASGLYLSLIHI